MNYSGNMPDWHQYNSPQPTGSEVPSIGQNVNHSPIFGPSISPRRLNGPNFSPEGLNKSQNDANFNPRNFQQSPNTINGPNIPPENSAMASAAQISEYHGHYGTPSPRNSMIESTNVPLDSRNPRGDVLSEAMGRNHQISNNAPAGPPNCSTINGSMGIMGQRNTSTGIQGPIPANIRQAPGPYVACKGPCCNSDTNLSYQSWEKFGAYPPNVPYRETGYPVDNRRFGSEFENRESLSSGTYNIDPRRNFPDYKYRKDPMIPREYPHASGVIQNYPVQNYNFPGDYQKYPGYPVKEYPRDSSITNTQNPAILKYQEQSVIVQQKYFTKQIQYQNGIIPKTIVPANMGGNIISRARNPYFNPQLARDIPRDYSESTSLANRGIQSANPIHATYPKYQMYQQKIAMQRFSMENHLRELTRFPGYQSHPKYQECILRYRELLRLQQTVDYQSTVQDAPRVITSQVNDEIPPINLQFDQNGHLINSNLAPAGFANLQNPNNVRNTKNLDSANNRQVEPQNLQHPIQYKTQPSFDNRTHDQDSSSVSQSSLQCENEERYSVAKKFDRDQYHMQKSQSEGLNVTNSEDGPTTSMDHKNSRDFADKPELDVRQFLANWDESEDEDGVTTNLPDVASNSSTSVVVEYGSTKSISNSIEESENCSETQDWQGTNDRRMLEETRNEMKSSNSTEDQIHEYNSPADEESSKPLEQDLDVSDSVKNAVRVGTVIQSTGTECENETSFHIIENLEDCRDTQGSVKFLCQETSSIRESQETSPVMKVDIAVKQESSIEEETVTSIKEHIEVYKYEPEVGIRSSIEKTIENDDNSRSSVEKDSPENTKHHYSSSEDSSESSDTDSTDSDTISSFIKTQKTIKGTEIHVDAEELSISPKSDSENIESPDLQKQSSFVSEESHNPDDISLPDLPTSECTPISTTLNTPIHSDSEESSEPVIDLTIPTNPIEIIQNSPMLSFMHSPIKMEPYEDFDENDLTEKVSHDDLEFKFETSDSSDNDCENPIDVCSPKVKQCNDPKENKNIFDSDSIEILSENEERNTESDTRKVTMKDVLVDSIDEENKSVIKDRFTCNKENVIVTDNTNNPTVIDQQGTAGKPENQIFDISKHRNDKTVIDNLEGLSDSERRLSIMSKDNEDHSEDELEQVSNAKQPRGYDQQQLQAVEYEIKNDDCELLHSITALNLVKDENKMNSDSIQISDKTTNLRAGRRESLCSLSNSDEQMHFENSNQGESDSSMDSQGTYTSSEHTDSYSSSSEEDQIHTKTTENQSNFTNSLNIPLIPGDDFEEPKMPVLPMEGNCLTKIIKNTSPITDLDVLGSDDDKLDKMDDIWIEVGNVDTVDKVTDVNADCLPESGESSIQDKKFSSKDNLNKLQKSLPKRAKNSVKAKDNKLIVKLSDDGAERNINSTDGKNLQPNSSFDSDTAQKEVETTDRNFSSAIISSQVSIASKITSNRLFREGGNSSHDICSENSVTVMMKCQEKANHINDIATKLLENARLFEPEQRKIEVLKSETNGNDNNRDDNKNRIKLLKEFRRVKNRINVAEPAIKSAKDMVEAESNIDASPIEMTDEYTKKNELLQLDDNITKNQETDMEAVVNVLPKTHISTKKLNADIENNRPHTPSADIVIPEKEHSEMSKDSRESSRNEHTSSKNTCIVNIADNVAVQASSNGISHIIVNRKVVNIFEEDITECAINLSKSSNDFSSHQTLEEKGCKINDNRNFCKTEYINIEKTIEVVSEKNQEKILTETKNHSSHSSQFADKKDNALCNPLTKENIEDPEIKNTEEHSVAENNRTYDSILNCTNSTEQCIFNEKTSYKDIQQLKTTIDDKKSKRVSRNPEEIKDSIDSDEDSVKIAVVVQGNCEDFIDNLNINTDEISKHVCEPGGNTEVNDSVANGDEKDETTVDEIIRPEIPCRQKNCQPNVVNASMINEEELMDLVNNSNDDANKYLANSPKEEVSIQTLDDSLSHINNSLNETDVTCSKMNTDQTSLCDESENVDKLITTRETEETDRLISDDCLTNYQKSIRGLDTASDFQEVLDLIHEDPKNSAKYSICTKSPVEASSKKNENTEYLENTDLNDINLPSGADKSLIVDSRSEPFELHNSFDCDFNNFDVAPNINSPVDNDRSSSWKYSKACARFEDCERYKNPDSFIDPILTSLESLDNLSTVPIYTTKDGKITYSPNPKFTYRALIIEAREREGYPGMRESYYNNNRTQEFSHYSKNSSTLRKRKSSDGYSYSRSYNKKNYEPREYGETSSKNANASWNRNDSNHSKYRHQTRVRNHSHHSAHHNIDVEKKITSGKIVQEKICHKYTNKNGASILNECDKARSDTSDNYRYNNAVQYEQSKKQSGLDFAWSRHKQDWNYEHRNSVETTLSRLDMDERCNVMRNNNLESTITTEMRLPVSKTSNQSIDCSSTEKFSLISDEIDHISGSTEHISSTKSEPSTSAATHYVEQQVLNSNREEFKSTHPKTEDKHLNDEKLLTFSSIKTAQVHFGLFASEWQDSSKNLVKQQQNLPLMDIPSKPLLKEIETNCGEEIKIPALYDDIDICEIVTSNINGKESHDADSSKADCVTLTKSVKSSETNERFNEAACEEVKLNGNGDESTIDNTESKDASCSIPVQIIGTNDCFDELKITETPEVLYDNESAPDFNEETESSHKDELNEPMNYTDDQSKLNIEKRDVDHEDFSKECGSSDKQTEVGNSKSIDKVQINHVALESNNEISCNLKVPCDLESLQDGPKIERKESKIENNIRETENRNKASLKNGQIKYNADLSVDTTFEHENVSKHHSQSENYIAYSPSIECPKDVKGIPKLVIKKTESLNCKNEYLDQLSKLSYDLSAGKVTDKDEQNSKVSVHPKIPKILIRNVKSRPNTPSIDEIIEKKVFSVTTKEENKVPKVKIRLEEKKPNIPAILPNETTPKTETTESKIPKMKIKLEDRMPKIFIENVNTEMNENIQKIVPKMKIKKLKGSLSQVAQILPVSIPRMLIYTELENEEQTSLAVTVGKRVSESDESTKSVVPNSIPNDDKTIKNTDFKKVPKLKIIKQSSGCTVELTRKRHNINPVQSELKKTKKSLKPIDPNDRKQSNRLFVSSEHLDSMKKETFNGKPSYELAESSGKTEYSTAAPHSQSTVRIKGDKKNSVVENSVSGTPEEIPKVIIKRASPSAEFKCELSKGRRDAIIKNKRWQPEVKLQRSWVLDCMAKDLNLDRLRLKLATPGSILKNSLTQKKSEVEEKCIKNDNLTNNSRGKKLFRSKSTSDLVLVHGDIGTFNDPEVKRLNDTNLTDTPKKLTTRKRCKSDLGTMFTNYSKDFQCKKKFKFSNSNSACSNDSMNLSNIRFINRRDAVADKLRKVKDLHTSLKNLYDSENTNGIADRAEILERNPNKTLDENMNSQSEISLSKIYRPNNESLMKNETSHGPFVDVDLNFPILSSFRSTAKSLDSECECFGNNNQITNLLTDNLDVNETQKLNDRYSCSSLIKHGKKIEDDGKVNAPAIAENSNPINNSNEKRESDINNSSNDNSNRADSTNRVSQSLISDTAMVKQASNSTPNGNVLNMSFNNNSNQINSSVKDVQDSKVDNDLNNSLSKAIATEDNSVLTYKGCGESQRIVEILSAPLIFGGSETEIQSCLVTNKDNDMCLYHEDAIPTQFELELEITDNVMTDTSEVPIPQNDYSVQEFCTSDELDESSHKSNPTFNNSEDVVNLEDAKSEISLPEDNGTNSFDSFATTYQNEPSTDTNKQGRILAADSDNRKSKSTMYIESTAELHANVVESFCQADLLIKEVLAAKETLRKCLTRSKSENRFKLKARPKTAAEKKQGSSFDLSMLSTSKDGTKPSINRIVDSANKSEKPIQSNKKTESKGNTLKSERKHSNGDRNNSKQKKYSSLPIIVQKYTNVAPMEGYNLIPQRSSIDVKDSVALTEDETTISLKNSKHLLKNNFSSDTRKKTPKIINSKDSKCRSKSFRQDGDLKYVEKSKSTLSNITVRESGINFDNYKVQSVSDAVNHKYKPIIPLSDQNVQSMTDKTKFKPYKIPKLTKTTHSENERSTEELQETRSKEIRMPILESQVDIDHGSEDSEFSASRESSRSPPVITNQEIFAGLDTTTPVLWDEQCQASSNKEKEDLLGQRSILLEKEVPETMPSYSKETTVADIVNDMAYHEKATIRHRRYCTLCERWFPTVAKHRRHLSGYQHRHTELTQRRTIHTLFTLFTGRPCPRLQPPGIVRIDCEPGELTPLQIAVEGVTKESNKMDGNIRTSTSEEK